MKLTLDEIAYGPISAITRIGSVPYFID